MNMPQRAKALREFQNDPPTTIFILSVRCGAVGLTLTAASHVFMMEPCINPALYQQAINQVYRLGQKNEVFIKTLVMKGTIEEQILEVNKKKMGQVFTAGSLGGDKANLRSEEYDMLFEEPAADKKYEVKDGKEF